jgi:hypothetical protein
VGPSVSVDFYGKPGPQPEFDPWTVQPVANRYTDYAILAHYFTSKQVFFRQKKKYIYFIVLNQMRNNVRNLNVDNRFQEIRAKFCVEVVYETNL